MVQAFGQRGPLRALVVASGLAVNAATGATGMNNVSVVVNSDGRVVTVGHGQFKPR
jgi:N-acetylglutamate synthase/N-acetylornithine aminotransferase